MRAPTLLALLLAAALPLGAQSPVKPDTAAPSPSNVCADRDSDGRCDDATRPRDCSPTSEDPDCSGPGIKDGACVDGNRDGRCDAPPRKRSAGFFAALGGMIIGLFVDNHDRKRDKTTDARKPGSE